MSNVNIVEQTKQLHDAEMYEVVKVGYYWKYKTLHGVETHKTKKQAVRMAPKWKEAHGGK